MAAFLQEIPVRFGDCDPGGWVFYPRYFEMISNLVEDWFSEGLEVDVPSLRERDRLLTPSVHFNVDFVEASRYGERLSYRLWVTKVGRTSCELHIQASLHGQLRLKAKQILVMISADSLRATPIPDELARRMRGFAPEANEMTTDE